jgi:Fur family zinc uptake transcriptional regulator
MKQQKLNNQSLVLNVLANNPKIMTAYEILNELQPHGVSAPLTVYRALDALQAQGKVHRIESLNGFIACNTCQNAPHASCFILCNNCDASEEIADPRINHIIEEWCDKFEFALSKQTIEISGLCSKCKTL